MMRPSDLIRSHDSVYCMSFNIIQSFTQAGTHDVENHVQIHVPMIQYSLILWAHGGALKGGHEFGVLAWFWVDLRVDMHQKKSGSMITMWNHGDKRHGDKRKSTMFYLFQG